MNFHLNKKLFSIFLLLLAFLVITSSCVYSQRSNSYSFFRLLYSGKKKKQSNQYPVQGFGSVGFKDSISNGNVYMTEVSIRLTENTDTLNYSNYDTSILFIRIHDGKNRYLSLVRLKDYDNKLWRLINDTLGVKVYDKNVSFSQTGNSIDYNSLLFHGNGRYFEAVTFWVTSTKKSIVKILNQLLMLELNPKEFRSKEDLMDRLLSSDKSIYLLR